MGDTVLKPPRLDQEFWMSVAVFAAICLTAITTTAQAAATNDTWTSVTIAARCPVTHSAGLQGNVGTTVCLNASGGSAQAIAATSAGVTLRVWVRMPSDATQLYARTTSTPQSLVQFLSAGAVWTNALGGVEVEYDEPPTLMEGQAWCLEPFTGGFSINTGYVTCVDTVATTLDSPVSYTNPDGILVDVSGRCTQIHGVSIIGFDVKNVTGILGGLCYYSNGTNTPIIAPAYSAEPHRDVLTARTQLMLATILAFILGLGFGWKQAARPPVELMS